MKMNAQTVGWLVFLALIKTTDFSYAPRAPRITLSDLKPTATEGSCIDIKCEVTNSVYDDNGAYWFWLKDAKWNGNSSDYDGTVIYSTNDRERPVSPDFAGRVTYIGSAPSSWKNYEPSPKPRCNILICNLKKNDSGEYSFRFTKGELKWSTTPNVTLKVKDNPCPITFEKPSVVNESGEIILTCSTLSSCPSRLQIEDSSQSSSTQRLHVQSNKSTTTARYTANWQDDGKVFSCYTQDNEDKYLIRNVTLTVEYAPRDISVKKSPENVKERDSVTLTCFAKGVPNPTITWLKNEEVVFRQAQWNITSIDVSQSGEYKCKAVNKHGSSTSVPVNINVTYAPDVEIQTGSSEILEGNKMILTCYVTRSNPPPHKYTWQKNGAYMKEAQTYVVDGMKPEDRGSYICTADNTVGQGTSQPLEIKVKYRPRKTKISIKESDVIDGQSLSFICDTDAYPLPWKYSWYRYNYNKQFTRSQWTSRTTSTNTLQLERVQRGDEGNYKCNATNAIDTGDDSPPVNIRVQYAPTNCILSMADELTENMTTTINCTVESFPPSRLKLTWTTSNSKDLKWSSPQYSNNNELHLKFNVTSTHAGSYTCSATNSRGSNTSVQRKLVVNYAPKDVRVRAQPELVVIENKSLTLHCSANSYPQVDSFTWMKTTDGKEKLLQTTQKLTVISASPSDIGQYRCEAKNTVGRGTSQKVQVNVKYAPKHINIIRAAEQQGFDGKRSVRLSCSSDGYPPVKDYVWYKKGKNMDVVSKRQNFTVYSDQPGDYFCVAKNEINEKASEPVTLFDGRLMMFLKIFLCLILTLLIILVIFFVYRRRKKNSIQQRTTQPCFGLMGWSNGIRSGNLTHETILAEPFRSRDVLLPDQLYHPEAQRRQPRPDSTPASNVTSVYCTVNVPARKQAPTAQQPTRLQGGHTVDDSLNYASLSFGDKQNNKQVKPAEDVYAKVSKSKPLKKKEQEWLEDYENISTTSAAKAPAPLDDDSDSSEDDQHLNYTQVNFAAEPGRQRASSDTSSETSSDTSSEDEIQYSDVKI